MKIEAIGDTGVKRLTLTDKAVERLAITTAPVTEDLTASGAATGKLLIPYSALLYLPDGTTIAYTNPEGHAYVREMVTVESIRGDQAVLTAGPPVGTAVVTAGAAELWGTSSESNDGSSGELNSRPAETGLTMLRWIVGTSLKFRFLVVAAASAVMAFGFMLLPDTAVDAFPEFAPPRVEVQVPCLGLSATEVEELVTVPLEQAMAGIPDLDVMRSKSVSDLSKIELRFDPGTDLLRARQLVAERVGLVTPSLPRWASPPFMIQPLSSTSRTMKIGMTSDTTSVIDMSMTAYWNIRARLLRVPGVANVAIWGERLNMYQVQTDPARLNASRVSLNEVMQATADALDSGLLQYSSGGFIGTGGFVETPNQRLSVENVLPIVTPEDLSQVSVAERDGRTLRLADVADVVEDHQPLIGDAVINDGPGLMLIVEKFPWANTVDVTERC